MRVAYIKDGIVGAMYNWDSLPQGVGADPHYRVLTEDETDAECGWIDENGVLVAPPPAVIDYGKTITVLAYRSRFTDDEKAMMDLLSIHDSGVAITDPANIQRAKVRQAFADLATASKVELDDPRTQSGAQSITDLLEFAGVIVDSDARYDEIINTPVAWGELREVDQAKHPKP